MKVFVMRPESCIPELSANVFRILADLIRERTGLHYDAAKRDLLAEKLAPLVVECRFNSFLDFYYLLKYGPNSERTWSQVHDVLSVPETYFWREIEQVQALADLLLQHATESRSQPVRIWSAACASGEEPLTIAMVLSERGCFDRLNIQIHASDASPAAICKARQGLYRERSFRVLSSDLQNKYFRRVDCGWQIDPVLQSRVTWTCVNLMQADDARRLAQVPFIFCRNVFIYFDEDTIARTVDLFAQCMQRPGYLFVGASESLLKITTDFELEQYAGAFVYALK